MFSLLSHPLRASLNTAGWRQKKRVPLLGSVNVLCPSYDSLGAEIPPDLVRKGGDSLQFLVHNANSPFGTLPCSVWGVKF